MHAVKSEKSRRIKAYEDLQIQGTNNSSIALKRSVEAIYGSILEPGLLEWFSHFVPKMKRRSPAINRGYWLRMEAIKETIHRIKALYNLKFDVVNLGCGFDPLPFKLLETEDDYCFIDIDYPDLVKKKADMMKDPKIQAVIGKSYLQKWCTIATDSYKLVGCNLNNTSDYVNILGSLLSSRPTIFIAEVSLAYMQPKEANAVAKALAQFPNSHMVVLEQIMPSGEHHFFAQRMLRHFTKLRTPLQCVREYPTKEMQRQRFGEIFGYCEVMDLFESWNTLVLRGKKELVAQAEEFDEWEEFIIFCQHYVIIHATNAQHLLVMAQNKAFKVEASSQLVALRPLQKMELKFPAVAEMNGVVYLHGGFGQTRSNLFLDITGNCVLESGPSARMCHTLTFDGEKLVLCGGRTRPNVLLSDIWTFDGGWHLVGNLPRGLSRHAAVSLGVGQTLVFGDGDFFLIDGKCKQLEGFGPRIRGANMVYDLERKEGYLFGGLIDEIAPTFNDSVYRFTLEDGKVNVLHLLTMEGLGRVGSVAFLEKSKLFIVGGAGPYLQDQHNTFIVIDEGTVAGVKLEESLWLSGPVIIGSGIAGRKIVGGGGVCYSFGSAYGDVVDFSFSNSP